MDLRTSSRILERSISKGKAPEINRSSFALLYAEIIKYYQNRSEGIEDLEQKLAALGAEVGLKMHQLYVMRERAVRRDTRLLHLLYYVQDTLYRFIFGKCADSLELSNDSPDEYMIIDLDPMPSRFISLPKELGQLCCNAFIAGMIASVLVALNYPAKVSAHFQPEEGHPLRTVFLVKFSAEVMEREMRTNSKDNKK